MKQWITSILLIAAFMSGTTSAGVLNVPGDFPGIQMAMDHAQPGDTVLVRSGIYYENINFRGKNIVVRSRFEVDQEIDMIQTTVIDGSRPVHPDSGSCVTFMSGEDSTAVIEGFTLTGGTGLRTYWQYYPAWVRTGGGVVVKNSTPTIKNNIIIHNKLSGETGVHHTRGGGISTFTNSRAHVYNNVIVQNQAEFGSALTCYYDQGLIARNNVIAYNVNGQTFGGGCIAAGLSGGLVVLENNTVSGNTVMSGYQDKKRTDYCIVCWHRGTLFLRNNIVYGNDYEARHIALNDQAAVDIRYTDFEGGVEGEGNLDISPVFSDTLLFYLTNESPCVDQGDPDSRFNDPADPSVANSALGPSRGGFRNDMGAFGGPGSARLNYYPLIPTSIKRDEIRPQRFRLDQNHPNPFNPVTSISYCTPRDGEVTLKIFTVTGREVETLVSGFHTAGEYHVEWCADALPCGVYVCRFRGPGVSAAMKMVMIK
jgi:hypothetical protein